MRVCRGTGAIGQELLCKVGGWKGSGVDGVDGVGGVEDRMDGEAVLFAGWGIRAWSVVNSMSVPGAYAPGTSRSDEGVVPGGVYLVFGRGGRGIGNDGGGIGVSGVLFSAGWMEGWRVDAEKGVQSIRRMFSRRGTAKVEGVRA